MIFYILLMIISYLVDKLIFRKNAITFVYL